MWGVNHAIHAWMEKNNKLQVAIHVKSWKISCRRKGKSDHSGRRSWLLLATLHAERWQPWKGSPHWWINGWAFWWANDRKIFENDPNWLVSGMFLRFLNWIYFGTLYSLFTGQINPADNSKTLTRSPLKNVFQWIGQRKIHRKLGVYCRICYFFLCEFFAADLGP